MADYPTPHINAAPEDFGKVVLMPGDPKRSEFIAKTYLQNARLVNNVRGVAGYTGEWKGETVSVMASGMGMPSIGIYSYELFRFFGVEAILRVGSAGALQPFIRTRDLVLGMGASTNSGYASQYGLAGTLAPICDYELLETAAAVCRERNARFHVGNLMSSDIFYHDNPDYNKQLRDLGVLAVEMEAAALYLNAARLGKKALAICTVSDHIFTGEVLSSDVREKGFGEMAEVALDTAANFLAKRGK